MKFKEIQLFNQEDKKLKNDFKWELKYWIQEHRLNYCYIRVSVDNKQVRIEMSDELSSDEIKELQNTFGMILCLKQWIKTENICYDIPLYPRGSSYRVIHIFQLNGGM